MRAPLGVRKGWEVSKVMTSPYSENAAPDDKKDIQLGQFLGGWLAVHSVHCTCWNLLFPQVLVVGQGQHQRLRYGTAQPIRVQYVTHG